MHAPYIKSVKQDLFLDTPKHIFVTHVDTPSWPEARVKVMFKTLQLRSTFKSVAVKKCMRPWCEAGFEVKMLLKRLIVGALFSS